MAVVAGLVFAAAFTVLAFGWTVSIVDSMAEHVSLAVDASDGVHVAYAAGDLRYAYKGILGWSITMIEALHGAFNIASTSIATDPVGHARIVYAVQDYSNGSFYATDSVLHYALHTASGPEVSILLYNGIAPSIAVDGSGRSRIAFVDAAAPFNLAVIQESGVEWTRSDVARNVGPSPFTQIAVDPSGHTDVAFGDYYSLGVATDASGTWQVTWINRSTSVFFLGPSMAVDGRGAVHLVYQSADPVTGSTSILYTTNAGGSWSTRVLERLNLGTDTAVTVDRQDHVHVAYFDVDNRSVHYATDASGTWAVRSVGPAEAGDVPIFIGVTANGRVHIAYAFPDLVYITNGADASNLGAFWVANASWLLPELAVCAYAFVRLLLPRRGVVRSAA